jgi:hypothetical protein
LGSLHALTATTLPRRHAGGSTAEAFASAYSAALSRDPNGCLVLSEARAYAYARCGQGGAFASSSSEVTSRVLGFCAQRTGFPPVPGFPPLPPFPFFTFPPLPSLFGPGGRRAGARRLLMERRGGGAAGAAGRGAGGGGAGRA